MKRAATDPRFRIGRHESTSDALSRLGYSHVRASENTYAHDVVTSNGVIVFTGNAHEASAWIKRGCPSTEVRS